MRWYIAVGAVVVGAAILAIQAPNLTLSLLLLAGVVFLYRTGRARLAPAYLSPIAIATFGLVGLGLLGAAMYADLSAGAGGASVEISLTAEQNTATMTVLIVAGLTVLVSGLLTLAMTGSSTAPLASVNIELTVGARWAITLASLVPLVLPIATGGFDGLLRRDSYIAQAVQDGGVSNLTGQLAIAALIALGLVLGSGTGGQRLLAAIGILGYLTVFFASGSRRLALLPVLVALGYFVAKRTKWAGFVLILGALASIPMIRLALFLRGQTAHGLIPYLDALPGFWDAPITWESVANNVLISFGIIGATAFQQAQITPELFWISVNPLPGNAVGWYEDAASLRINLYTPYAAVGELANHGWAYLIGYFAVVGVLLALLERQVRWLIDNGLALMSVASVGLTGLFLLYSIQYNLRSSTRMIFYAIAAAIAIQLVAAAIIRRRNRVSRSPVPLHQEHALR